MFLSPGLDYCNSLYNAINSTLLAQFQTVQNALHFGKPCQVKSSQTLFIEYKFNTTVVDPKYLVSSTIK